jgi:hypothetical protein
MKRISRSLFIPSIALATFALISSPALAQSRRGQNGDGGRHAQPRASAPARSGERDGRSGDNRSGRATPAPRARVDSRVIVNGPGHRGYFVNGYRRPIFARPYYAFRPRTRFSFGLSIGYPVAYPYGYFDSWAYPGSGYVFDPRYDSRYLPSYSNSGGISFDIDPYDAAVFIDGAYAGTVADFGPTEPPLTLVAGRHHVELRSRSFRTMAFDITVVPGQVIPYEGSLSRNW